MGTPFAVAYVNINMGNLESKLLEKFPHKAHTHIRYFDAILTILERGPDHLNNFKTFLNIRY